MRTDGQTDMKKLIVAFRNFGKELKNQQVNTASENNRYLFRDLHKTRKHAVCTEYRTF
jgi:hypothetical protein